MSFGTFTSFIYPFFSIPVSRVFIIIHRIENHILFISDLKDIVDCHSIHLILLTASALVQVILYVYHYFSKIVFTDFLHILLIFMNKLMQPFE